MTEENFTMDLDAEHLSKYQPNEGGGFKRVPYGDYKVRIVDVEQKPKTGDKPHVMLKPTFVIVEARDPANAHAVGMTVEGLYAGSRQSPKFMQERLACLIRGAGIQVAQGQSLSRSMFIGREMDATITWELSAPKFDEQTGAQKRYVNSRLIAERPVGSARPATINPAMDSRESVKYLEATYGEGAADAPTADTTQAPPWAQPETAAPAQAAAPAAQSTFRPETDADPTVMQYRAYVKLASPQADAARAGLIQAGFDPDGPVDAGVLPEPLKAAYLAKFPQAGNGAGLPGLPGLPGGAKPKTGTRTKSA